VGTLNDPERRIRAALAVMELKSHPYLSFY